MITVWITKYALTHGMEEKKAIIKENLIEIMRQLEILCGCEVPKIVKGWNIDGHFGDGNSILDATDMVTKVGTTFEKYESNRYKELYDEHDAVRFDFKFSIGYSKRGLKQILKKY